MVFRARWRVQRLERHGHDRGLSAGAALTTGEVEALPILARGSALRFMLTRLVDWLNVPPGALVAPKNPLEYRTKLRFHQRVVSALDYGWRA